MINEISKYVLQTRKAYPRLLQKLLNGEVFSDCQFNHHTHTDYEIVDLFWKDQYYNTFATKNLEFLQSINIVKCSYVAFYTSCSIKAQLATKYLTRMQEFNSSLIFSINRYGYDRLTGSMIFVEDTNMPSKFNGIFLNPPFSLPAGESTNTIDIYPEFFEKFIPLTMDTFGGICPRSGFGMEASSFRKYIFDGKNITALGYLDKKTFSADVNTCYMIIDATHIYKTTRVTDQQNRTKDIKITVDSIVLWGDIRWTSVFQKIKLGKTFGDLWNRGPLNGNEIIEDKKHGEEFILNMGKTGEPLVTTLIKPYLTDFGLGKWKVCFANMGRGDGKHIGPVKIAGPKTLTGHSVCFIEATSEKDASQKKEALEDSFFEKLIAVKKTATPNAKHLFDFLPLPTFSGKFTAKKMMDQLDLDETERDLFSDN